MPKRGQCGFAHFLFLLILLFALVYGQRGLAGQTDHQAGVVQAIHIDSPIRIDGRLTESAWRKAMPVTSFRQREPREGEPATERTEVRIVFDNQNLYLGVRCFDAQPQLIIAKEMETDGRLSLDDNFTLILDTYHDNRSGFYFQINPNAAKLDAQLGDGGDSFNRNWNGIWDVRARITSDGWEAEIILPFKTLRFSENETQTWGINFRRFIRRKNEEDLWQAWHRNQGIRQLSAEGRLLLPWQVKRGKNLELKPYMTSGFQAGNPAYGYRNDQQWKTGLDAKYAITPTLTADLTLHTDFAQVEADRARINLTRFSLFFPEKRDFFLESESNFSFGASRRAMAFYSRSIGLSPSGQQIPILGGVRLSGKVGKNNLGFLNIQTSHWNDIPGTNFTVLRIKRDIFQQSYFGMIFTQKTPATDSPINRVIGSDLTLSTSHFLGNQNVVFHTYYMKSLTGRHLPQNHSFRVFVDYPNDLFDNFFQYFEVGKNFNPEIGFVRRKDMRMLFGHIRFMPRPHLLNVRQLVFKIQGSYITDFNNVLQSRFFEYRPLGFELHSGEEMEFNIQTDYERLDQPFNIFENISIPTGIYNMLRWEIQFSTNSSRPVSGELFWNWGEFYTGHSSELSLASQFRLNKYVSLSGDYRRTGANLAQGRFTTHEASARINVNFTTHLTTRLFVQWNNEDDEINFNFRLRWIPKLGSDVYLVYNTLQDTRLGRIRSKDHVLLLKFTYWMGV